MPPSASSACRSFASGLLVGALLGASYLAPRGKSPPNPESPPAHATEAPAATPRASPGGPYVALHGTKPPAPSTPHTRATDAPRRLPPAARPRGKRAPRDPPANGAYRSVGKLSPLPRTMDIDADGAARQVYAAPPARAALPQQLLRTTSPASPRGARCYSCRRAIPLASRAGPRCARTAARSSCSLPTPTWRAGASTGSTSCGRWGTSTG